MKFYRALRPFKAISFDLDDTLYDNHPVMKKAEADFITHLNVTYPELAELTSHQWGLYKKHLAIEFPALKEDVSLWRIEILKRIMVIFGIVEYKAIEFAQDALAEFLRLRSNFTVPKSSFDLLATLAEHYPVIAITNGNVDTDKINLSDKFQFILKAGDGLNAKPEGDLFIKAARILDIEVSDILHIGDHLISDVYGAENNGAQAIWFNEHDLPLTDAKTLPSVEISNVELLIPLLLQKDQ